MNKRIAAQIVKYIQYFVVDFFASMILNYLANIRMHAIFLYDNFNKIL